MAARGLVNGRSPLRRSGRDLVFRCYPPELLSPHKKTEADLLGQPLMRSAATEGDWGNRSPCLGAVTK